VPDNVVIKEIPSYSIKLVISEQVSGVKLQELESYSIKLAVSENNIKIQQQSDNNIKLTIIDDTTTVKIQTQQDNNIKLLINQNFTTKDFNNLFSTKKLTDLIDVDDTDKAEGKTLQVDSEGNHIYVDLPGSNLTGYAQLSGAVFTGDVIAPDVVKTRSGVITRIDGYISQISKTGGRTIDFTRDINNRVTSVTDSDRTWSFTRDINNKISEWSVA
jgi:hypothetical protein